MSAQEFRYTGDFPPADVLERFPNLEYALDEEHAVGHDETTLRPASEQTFVTAETAFTAGQITQQNGTKLTAMLEVENSAIQGFTVLVGGEWAWAIGLLGKPSTWQSMSYEWLPESQRPPSVSLGDPAVFPLAVESLLPLATGGRLKAVISRGL